MRVLILGGDGYLGWPTAMRFSGQGHEVAVADSFARRRWVEEAGSHSLTPIVSLVERIQAWSEVSGKDIEPYVGDIAEGTFIADVVREFEPDAIVHYGEQPSAPWSMKSVDHAVMTQANNVIGSLKLLWAMRDYAPAAHLIKLGTMGEYGTPNIDIEEGFIEIDHKGRKDTLPFPKLPGSLYHLSKVHDSHNIHFACRIWGLRATDLNQGVVYGIETPETRLDDRLITRFDYDELFGTALNRFAVQAVIGHPLTVYGKGGQTRGFLNIVDTLQCVSLTAENPPTEGEYRVFNQFTEVFNVGDLAEKVRHAAGELGIDVRVDHVTNPRLELEEHYYNPTHTKLLELGLQPTLLSETLIESMLEVIRRYQDRVLADVIDPVTQWRPEPLSQRAE
ncbi:MAG TPA: NAD-dependent epimerase/dehydratase family protein [Gaiellaceae bacterium]|nr:NAD-dependent epimerase/dehydratase family protein [Gaiellaceae bacterium]